jgi:hypothetical protein
LKKKEKKGGGELEKKCKKKKRKKNALWINVVIHSAFGCGRLDACIIIYLE